MNEEEMMMGLSDTGAGAGGMPPPAPASAEAPAGVGKNPAEEFTDILLDSIRPVIVDLVTAASGGARG